MENKPINFEKMEQLPDSAFQELVKPDPPETPQSTGTAGRSEISETDVLSMAKHTENTPLSGLSGTSENTGSPNKDSAGKSPETSLFSVPGTSAGSIISGDFAVNILDVVFPVLFAWGAGAIGYQMDKRHLQLNEGEKKILVPAFQSYLDSVNLRMTPLQSLLIALTTVYGSKVMDKFSEFKKKENKPKNETPADVAQAAIDAKDEREEKRKQTVKAMAGLNKAMKIAYIQRSMKLSKEKATQWVNKNDY